MNQINQKKIQGKVQKDMQLQKVISPVKYLYHYTTRENAQQIIKERTVRCFQDRFTFFTASREDAVKVCHNVLKEGTLYIDHDLTLKRRALVDFNDYVILRIPCPDDTEFYHLQIDHSANNFCAYDYSLMHKGELHFKKCKLFSLDSATCITRIPAYRKTFNRAAAIAGVALLLGTLWTSSVYAAGNRWLDSGNYDISWAENSAKTSYEISTASQLAGLSYLANIDKKAMDGKTFILKEDIDLSSMEWTMLPETFKGTIEGAHKIILSTNDTFIHPGHAGQIKEISFEYVTVNRTPEVTIETNFSCMHSPKLITVQEATPDSDTITAEQCEYCNEILEYGIIPGTACASFLNNTADAILHTKESEVVADTSIWTCLDRRVTDALMERPDVALTLNYTYRGIRYTVTIPAGTNAAELLDANGYCGFRYLDSLFHGSILTK